ncbi:hypothetical protein [Yersinia massiliensis]|uniref:hypothetical protein n=1 Tax=Yersinia massiliensis TaxID=419257 RepID=UPI00119D9305|nr:hypothetical protein [Yersinia massiliensis]
MKHNAYSASTALLISLLSLSGCQSIKKPLSQPTSALEIPEEKISLDTLDLKQCQRNLSALGVLKADNYLAQKKTFGDLMSGASQYASIRAQVNEHTQNTVDALYHYQVNYQCAEINQTLLAELAKRGGAMK